MKKLKSAFFVVFMVVFAVLSINATLYWDRVKLDNGWKVITMTDIVLPGDTTFTSSAFSLPRSREIAFDDTSSLMKSPMCFYVDVDSATYAADTTVSGDVTYLITLQGAVTTSGTFSNVDTLYNSSDSDSTVTAMTLNLNSNLYPLYPYYRIRVAATGVKPTAPADSNGFTIKLW